MLINPGKTLLTVKSATNVSTLFRYAHFQRSKCVRPVPAICSEMNQDLPECLGIHEREKLLKERERKKVETKKQFISMWENPECCIERCADLPPRYDALYYYMSDKYKRKYQQTWVECPSKKKPVVVCCYEELDLPPPEIRKRGVRPSTACEYDEICPRKPEPCARIVLPGCKKARIPPKCFIIRRPSDCKKVCTPYPAYSECLAPKRPPPRPTECRCLEVPPLCVVYELLAKGIIKLVKGRKSA